MSEQAPRTAGDLRQENVRLHNEIRGLNGQIEGLTRVMAGQRARIAVLQQKIAELEGRAA